MRVNKEYLPFIFIFVSVLVILASGTFFYFRSKPTALQQVSQKSSTDSSDISSYIHADDQLMSAGKELAMVVYDDPSETFAPRYLETLVSIKERFSDRISIALRVLPREKNADSDYYCSAVLCAGEQDKYLDAYALIVKANKEKKLTKEAIPAILEELVLDMDKFAACLGSEEMESRIEKIKKDAENESIIGVPSTFINGHAYPGAYPLEDFTDSSGNKRDGLVTVIERHLGE